VLLGSASLLADQPEFTGSNERMRDLLSLTERRDLLATALGERARRGLTITIGGENPRPAAGRVHAGDGVLSPR
jgi:transcriptional regulator of heat shock response